MESILSSIAPQGFRARMLEEQDFEKGYLDLMSHLAEVEALQFSKFREILELMDNYYIVVLEDLSTLQVVASGTLFIEQKLIREGKKVGHIDDVVVSQSYQKLGLAQHILGVLKEIALSKDCYKVILECEEEVSGLFEKCGFQKKGLCMAEYINN